MARKVPGKKVNGTRVINRYISGAKNKAKRAKQVANNKKAAKKGNPRYDKSSWSTDKNVKTKPSKYTRAYKRKFGNGSKK